LDVSLIRVIAKLCIEAARGVDIEEELIQLVDSGMELEKILTVIEQNKVLPLIVVPLKNVVNIRNIDQTNFPLIRSAKYYLLQNLMLKSQLVELDKALENENIHPVLLKGAIHIFDPIYPCAHMRSMYDLDIYSNNPEILHVLQHLGYRSIFDNTPVSLDDWSRVELTDSHHVDPLVHPEHQLSIEIHKYPCLAKNSYLLEKDFNKDSEVIPGCTYLRKPSAVNHLNLALVHSLLDTAEVPFNYHLRGLVECEILYERLSSEEQQIAFEKFCTSGGAGIWVSWRALADWVFRSDDKAVLRSPRSFWLITEYRLRAHSVYSANTIAFIWKMILRINPRFWLSGRYRKTYLFRFLRG